MKAENTLSTQKIRFSLRKADLNFYEFFEVICHGFGGAGGQFN